MNKIIPLIAILDVIAAGGVSGCHKEKNSDWETIKTNKTEVVFSANGGFDSVETTNYSYWWILQVKLPDIDSTLYPDPNEAVTADWLLIESDKNKLYMRTQPNLSESNRQARVDMSVGNSFKIIDIIQEAK
ncbi:MAG: hypothetical protein IKR98_02655 [Bacteroidaceae bacterium]|nr:hypothetical protein [Bacteroidaceae bacterium]